MSDPRFARLKSDPRFRKPKRARNKVVIDSRFKSLLGEEEDTGGKVTQKARVDKYGRKVSKSKDKDNLRRFYRLDEDEEGGSNPAVPAIDYARGAVLMESSSEEDSSDESDGSDAGEVTIGRQVSQPSTSKGKKAGELPDIDLDESTFADLDAQAKAYTSNIPEEEDLGEPAKPTSRLAAVNLDWDHVTAAHLFRVATSVLPTGGKAKVLQVVVYPSEFGRERMEREEREGPPKELFKKGRGARADEVDSDEEVNEQTIFALQDGENDYDDDALRQYQLDRLRYYYAIIACDSPSTASHIYNELHGTELERSANVFDFSYVPEDMTFTQEARDECTSEAQASTKGMDFVTDALRHSKVKLSWDDDDPERNKITRRRMTRKEVEEEDFRALLASSSEEEAEDVNPSGSKRQDRERLRGLLLGGDNEDLPEGWGDDGDGKGKSGDLEITFMPALSSKSPVNEEEETTLDRYKRKQKEKREQKKAKHSADPTPAKDDEESGDEFFGDDSDEEPAPSKLGKDAKGTKSPKGDKAPRDVSNDAELELLLAPDPTSATENEPKHFDMRAVIKAEKASRSGKKSRQRGKKGPSANNEAEDGRDFHIDVKDKRFAALHENYEFAIDPSNPHFQNTKAMKALLDERSKRQRERQTKEESQAREKIKSIRESSSDDRSLKSIVESVKRKSNATRLGIGKRQKL